MPRSQAFSFGLHVLLALLLLAASRSLRSLLPSSAPLHVTPLTFFRPRTAVEQRSGGGNRTALPARHGSPPPTAQRTFIPPASSDHPALALPITIAFDIPIDNSIANIGDPLSYVIDGALGMRGHNGIGDIGGCCGIGDSPSGRPGLGVQRGRGVTPPELLYKVEPEFSEEARKAKHQGVVVLTIEVDASGNVRNVRVRQSLGLGLDEKAMDAVSQWRFRPGILNGKAVATEATIQVNFQLL
ncbi:MAG TPA: energy transducer TonB [Bryobacteraceae bacterium]|nr:energy transducer TonB [Bryobacteraceae bacterium]